MTAKDIEKLPKYSDPDTKIKNRNEWEGTLAYHWYYFTKYFGYENNLVLGVEDLPNTYWGFGFTIKAYFESATALKQYRFNRLGCTGLYYAIDGKECSVPIRWEYIVGKKGRDFLTKVT